MTITKLYWGVFDGDSPIKLFEDKQCAIYFTHQHSDHKKLSVKPVIKHITNGNRIPLPIISR